MNSAMAHAFPWPGWSPPMTAFFAPDFSRKLADAFRAGGGKVDFRALPAYDGEGHWMAETENGVKLAAPELDRLLKGAPRRSAAKKP